ncbi:FecCD family ABC transporter permease [Parapusillimonas granuli]|uniref:Iron ABC transporter permease n=1 Tax=Parapusillimonas granuli TaxID=380911 RepID=A0A853FX86_9BURK|nr:iron ABC transporter permease [Parapusillimonas granuli]MBB5216061.1 iron complex transport system permease protein [Parapusillimonas granuli]MEB2401333.1 iron ABC transporter permease [Alcaligenaceae bacterium]NYT50645.1 iron ABC transporter permease [Parapusillimonas granuli]
MATASPAHTAHRAAWRRRARLLGAVLAAILILAVLDVLLGPSGIGLAQLWRSVADPQSGTAHVIFWHIRLPQALMAVLVGAALGLAGAEMQTVLDNPLASPYTLGVSSAAALGAALTLVFQWRLPLLSVDHTLIVSAFSLALLCTLTLDAVAKRARIGSAGIVLFGIALVFAFNALLSLIQLLANAAALQDLVFWMMGSLARSDWPKLTVMAGVLAAVFPFALRNAWRLTALRFGDARAVSFGADPARTRRWSLLRVSMLASVAVALVGVIGFIGLIAPHVARRLWGEDHRWYLPASAATGSLILLGASVAAKLISDQVVIPVGIVTTLVGIPFFVIVLTRRRAY